MLTPYLPVNLFTKTWFLPRMTDFVNVEANAFRKPKYSDALHGIVGTHAYLLPASRAVTVETCLVTFVGKTIIGSVCTFILRLCTAKAIMCLWQRDSPVRVTIMAFPWMCGCSMN